jgi:alpha-glucosidase
VGGFHHNTTGELLARWTQLGALTPFFRNHSNIGTIDQEPWAFGRRIESICRNYIQLRYQLLPYLYGLFAEAHRRGTPIMRPTFWHYQNDPAAVAAGDQFMLGPDVLVAPILRQSATARSVYLPAGVWFDFWTGEPTRGGQHILAHAPLEVLPIFVRAGAIVPLIAEQQFIKGPAASTVNLHIWPGSAGQLDWYEDDGVSLGYQNGEFHERQISVFRRQRSAYLRFGPPRGSQASGVRQWWIVLRSLGRRISPTMAGKRLPTHYYHDQGIGIFEVPNLPEAFDIRW